MKISEVYKRFKTPPNLQEHMLRVTKVAKFICDHWKGEKIDKELVSKAALVHDLGNIVKFDFEGHPEFLGEKENERVSYWMVVQKQIKEKYGEDDHEVSEKMLQEIEAKKRLLEVVGKKTYANAVSVANSNDWEAKILLYADLRVGPFGVMSLRDRLDEVHSRSAKYRDRKDLYNAALDIEKEIQENLDINVSEISEKNAIGDDKELLSIEI